LGEVCKAIWVNSYYDYGKEEYNVVLKRIYNSNDKIADILSEVKISLLMLNVDSIPLNKNLCKFIGVNNNVIIIIDF